VGEADLGLCQPPLVGIGEFHTQNPIPQEALVETPPSFPEVIRAGDTLTSLEAVRDQIAADLQFCDSMRDKAALYLRLADVLRSIDELRPATVKGDAVDEIAARRAARGAGPAPRAARTKRPG
jgi:hypothetical protein